jgi:hypothetical protein
MTTWTTEDRENASPPHVVDSGASYEPIPFAGMVAIQDQEDTETMLRHQLHILNEQLNVVKAECQRLRNKLKEAGIND